MVLLCIPFATFRLINKTAEMQVLYWPQFVGIIACSLFLTRPCASQEKRIRCTAGTFSEGGVASVTCNFNQNLKQSRKNFNIVHYSTENGSTNTDGNYVLVCNWGSGSGDLDCKTDNGYEFNKQVSNTLTLGIPNVSTQVGGVYVCQIVPDDGVIVDTCTLNVQNATLPIHGVFPNVPCPDTKTHTHLLIAVIVILIIVFLMITSGFFIYFRTRCRLQKKSGGQEKNKTFSCCSAFQFVRRSPDSRARYTASHEEEEAVSLCSETLVDTKHGHRTKAKMNPDKVNTKDKKDTPQMQTETEVRPSNNSNVEEAATDSSKATTGNAVQGPGAQESGPPESSDRGQNPELAESQQPLTRNVQMKNRIQHGSKEDKKNTGITQTSDQSQQAAEKQPPMPALGYENWTTDEVCQWLKEEGLGRYVEAFQKQNITGGHFLRSRNVFCRKENNLGYNMLGTIMGIKDPKERDKIFAKVDELKDRAREEMQ